MSDPKPEDGCKWVKKGWALHPSDFFLNNTNGRVTAGVTGDSWKICEDEHLWQRPRELDIDILHAMKQIKIAANKMDEISKQKILWEMLQVTASAARELSKIRDAAEAAAKALVNQP